MAHTVDPPVTSKSQLSTSGDSVPESHAAASAGLELGLATLSLGAVDTDNGEPATLLSESLDSEERKLWAATATRLAGLSLEDERKRIIAILEKGYPAKEGGTNPTSADLERVRLPKILPYMQEYSRPYFFGWPVTLEWLALFEECASPYVASVGEGCIGNAMWLLKELCNAARDSSDFDLITEYAVHKDAPVQPEDDKEEWPPADLQFWMVSIRNTVFACDQIFARPTRAQYAWLNEIMPGDEEPQWFKSFHSRAQYYDLIS